VELICLAFGGVAFVLGLAITPLVRRIALRCNFMDHPGPRKIHSESISYGGGLAVAVAFLIAAAAGSGLLHELLTNPHWAGLRERLMLGKPDWEPDLPHRLLFCVGGAFGALLLGLYDDCRPLTPFAKLAGQFVLAIIVVAGGVRLTALVGDTLLMQTVTVLWIVLLTNSFNLLDNMDGLCSGNGAIGAGLLSLVSLSTGEVPVALLAAALAGACLGFLKWNFSPAVIFLGDAGSMFIGFLMATLSVVTTYYHYHESPLSIGVPFLILAIPFYDTASVLFIRLCERRALLKGDTSHFSHRLVDLGMTRRQAVATIHLAALAIGLPAIVILKMDRSEITGGLLLVAQAILILTVIAMLERAGYVRRQSGGGPRNG
jgi:UDP-GlcNAc:undecaprenyl-phosphate/decaprenyl-phosphate GlcNAc-1-phosphate transferase